MTSQRVAMLLVHLLSIWWNIKIPPGTMTIKANVNIRITQGLILTRRQHLLIGNVANLVTLKGIAKVLRLEVNPMVQALVVQGVEVLPPH